MYIMIHESGDMLLVKELTPEDLEASDDGIIDLIDVSTADNPLRYFEGNWNIFDKA